MNYFLIDYENVGPSEMKQLKQLWKAGDMVVIFHSSNSTSKATIPLDFVASALNSNVKLKVLPTSTGTKNALDFQLATYLGYLAAKDKAAKYHIISNDKGFDCLCWFWAQQSITVKRVPTRKESPAVAVAKNKSKSRNGSQTQTTAKKQEQTSAKSAKSNSGGPQQKTTAKAAAQPEAKASKKTSSQKQNFKVIEISECLGKTSASPQVVQAIVNRNSKKLDVHNDLMKKYGKTGSSIYKKIKPLLKTFK